MAKPIPRDLMGNPIFTRIWYNVYEKNMNQLILVSGMVRKGKSWLCEYLAYELDRDSYGRHLFNPKNNVASNFDQLLNLTKTHNRRGEVFVWEEAGTIQGTNSRKFYEEKNIIASSLFQILGYKGQIVIVNLPLNFMLDKQVRSIFHASIVALDVDIKNGTCLTKFKWLSIDPETNKIYGKFPRYMKGGLPRKGSRVIMQKPPQHIIDAYTEIENKFKDEFVDDFTDRLAQSKEKTDRRLGLRVNLANKLEDAKSNPDMYWDYSKDCPNTAMIRIKLELTRGDAQQLAKVWKEEVTKGIANV